MRHTCDRRSFLQAAALGLAASQLSAAPPEGETLYNGIRLPSQWPPRRTYSREPMPVPYLDRPPAVIPIDVGRQLFFDDFLIARTDLTVSARRITLESDASAKGVSPRIRSESVG